MYTAQKTVFFQNTVMCWLQTVFAILPSMYALFKSSFYSEFCICEAPEMMESWYSTRAAVYLIILINFTLEKCEYL